MMLSSYGSKVAFLMAVAIFNVSIRTTDAFVTVCPMSTSTATSSRRPSSARGNILLHSEKSTPSSTCTINNIHPGITINDKIVIRDPTPEERGKGGVQVISSSSDDDGMIKALEVLARIPRDLVIASSVDDGIPTRVVEAVASSRNVTWATELTAVTLAALHPTEEEISSSASSSSKDADDNNYDTLQAKKEWIQSWQTGGWGSNDDLGPDISNDVTGTLLATGSDNDHNIYAKFRMPCHPAVFKASMGLELLTECTGEEAREALAARGFTYRSMRDELQLLVLTSTERPNKGSKRDKRSWDVADMLSRVLSRATTLQLDGDGTTIARAIVPIHERLAHSLNENTKLVSIGNEVLLVAARDIEAGEPITRDYTSAPRMANDVSLLGSPLHLLLQFGLPPNAWPASN